MDVTGWGGLEWGYFGGKKWGECFVAELLLGGLDANLDKEKRPEPPQLSLPFGFFILFLVFLSARPIDYDHRIDPCPLIIL